MEYNSNLSNLIQQQQQKPRRIEFILLDGTSTITTLLVACLVEGLSWLQLVSSSSHSLNVFLDSVWEGTFIKLMVFPTCYTGSLIDPFEGTQTNSIDRSLRLDTPFYRGRQIFVFWGGRNERLNKSLAWFGC